VEFIFSHVGIKDINMVSKLWPSRPGRIHVKKFDLKGRM